MSATIPESVTIEDLELARGRLAGIVKPTPLIHSETLSQMLAAEVYLKPENLQKTGSRRWRRPRPRGARWRRRPAIMGRLSPGPRRARACARRS
jgi:hypothetical protein